ncbi:MAG: PilZ domain-containing protein [Deltaproteobacteria bacterium]|nr:PilZ domain-containing protein [Deltaproteobacteria bacterium]
MTERRATRTDRRQRPGRGDKRRFPRRAKSLRFRFEHDGELHPCVTTSVSLSGAFVKAAHVPQVGTILVLDERFNPDGVTISIRGEVVWSIDHPTLERPDTGFGFRFLELFTRADPGMLEDFLRALDPAYSVATGGEIAYEERANGVHAVFRFPYVDADPSSYGPDSDDSIELEDAPVIDLASELERLSREEARAGRDQPPDSLATDSSPFLAVAPPALPAGPPPVPSPHSDEARARSRKRSVTGIFTALFGRGSREERPVQSEPTPAIAGEDPGATLVHDPRRPRLLLSWGPKTVVARIESLGRQAATLWTNDAAPDGGEAVTLRPVGAPSGLQQLVIHAVVRTREDRQDGGLSWLSLDFVKVDEQGRKGRFQDYLRLVNGPGGDER